MKSPIYKHFRDFSKKKLLHWTIGLQISLKNVIKQKITKALVKTKSNLGKIVPNVIEAVEPMGMKEAVIIECPSVPDDIIIPHMPIQPAVTVVQVHQVLGKEIFKGAISSFSSSSEDLPPGEITSMDLQEFWTFRNSEKPITVDHSPDEPISGDLALEDLTSEELTTIDLLLEDQDLPSKESTAVEHPPDARNNMDLTYGELTAVDFILENLVKDLPSKETPTRNLPPDTPTPVDFSYEIITVDLLLEDLDLDLSSNDLMTVDLQKDVGTFSELPL